MLNYVSDRLNFVNDVCYICNKRDISTKPTLKWVSLALSYRPTSTQLLTCERGMASGQETETQPDRQGDTGVVVDVKQGDVAELLGGNEAEL